MDPKVQARRITKFALYAFGAFILVFIILALTGAITYEKALIFTGVGLIFLIVTWAVAVVLIIGGLISKLVRKNLK